ncbi:MAG: energy transducer TonB [bacterium]
MKTTNLIRSAFVIVLLLCISVFSASAIEPPIPPAVHIQKVIKEGVKYPEHAVSQGYTGTVHVTFTISEDGKINIEDSYSENVEIEKAVKEQLSAICCKGIKTPFNKHYEIAITFKLIG